MNRVTAEQKLVWASHVKRFSISNLSLRAYSEKHKLKLTQFSYWQRKLTKKPTSPQRNKSATHNPSKRGAKASNFVPVQVSRTPESPSLTITLPNGISIGGINDSNQHLVSSVLGACK